MDRYKELIKSMPVNEHAFTTRKSTWEKFTDAPSSKIISEIFGQSEDVEISRTDLFNYAKESNLKKLIIATILWGYPAGMRGNHFKNISQKLDVLEECLKEAKNGIKNWETHYAKTKSIRGLGLSTYTKLLYFCGAKVENIPCVILDQRIIDAVGKGAISGLKTLKGIAPHNANKKYPEYLRLVDDAAIKYGASHGSIEMFIFTFGLNIKPLQHDNSLQA